MTGVRVRREGWEGRCDKCRSWWPLTAEFWYPQQGVRQCRACLREKRLEANARRRADPALRAADNEAMQLYRRANAEHVAEQRREYYRKNRERINAGNRRRYKAKGQSEEQRAYKREWMRRHRQKLREEIAEGLAA